MVVVINLVFIKYKWFNGTEKRRATHAVTVSHNVKSYRLPQCEQEMLLLDCTNVGSCVEREFQFPDKYFQFLDIRDLCPLSVIFWRNSEMFFEAGAKIRRRTEARLEGNFCNGAAIL